MSLTALMHNENYQLIVTIVKKGMASKLVAATKKAGAHGGTTFYGRGTADKSTLMEFLGMDLEPEREIILTLAKTAEVDSIMQVITKEGHLDKPGCGISFVVNVKGLAGIVHWLEN